jgi:hypothetical protein
VRPAQLRRWHATTVTLKSTTGVDEYGTPAFSTSSIRARVVRKARRARGPDGEEITSMAQVQTLATVNVGDVLEIDGTDHRVRAIERAASLRGTVTITEAML